MGRKGGFPSGQGTTDGCGVKSAARQSAGLGVYVLGQAILYDTSNVLQIFISRR